METYLTDGRTDGHVNDWAGATVPWCAKRVPTSSNEPRNLELKRRRFKKYVPVHDREEFFVGLKENHQFKRRQNQGSLGRGRIFISFSGAAKTSASFSKAGTQSLGRFKKI